jgi:serine phosphatase RsbU (regulator of sigma subunit)
MSSRAWLALIACSFAVAFGISALLYYGSRSADFDRHARAVEAIGRVRTLDRQLSEQVLAARFGLLNQYDSINESELGLGAANGDLAPRVRDAIAVDAVLESALVDLDAAISAKRAAAEHFKTENSILRNSTYYLPTAANEVGRRFRYQTDPGREGGDMASIAAERIAQTGLAYNLIGDGSARQGHLRALAELRMRQATVPDDLRQPLASLLAHGDVIAREVPAVDGWVKRVVSSEIGDKLTAIEHAYQARFDRIVVVSNRYRRILYGWSLVLLVAVGIAGVQLRRAYAGLELRVVERTAEVRQALAELWGEMRLARKIQEALVPAAPTVSDCDIAARMEATEEVGGDYYDVIRTKDCDWILIGDVSGHGVPAGLIMMMCHTAVRTVLRCNPDVGPDTLLALVNSVLTLNIRQLREDKYMTISAFRRSHDGTVRFAGAHQDVFIYRAATSDVEMLSSRGLWLGLREEISQALPVQEFRLEVGDQLLLYTDGVTEAIRSGVMFDTEGVRRVLLNAGKKSAADVVVDVFRELKEFQVNDDATVLVVKQRVHPATESIA